MPAEEAHLVAEEARVHTEGAHLVAEGARVHAEEARVHAEGAHLVAEEARVVAGQEDSGRTISVPRRWAVRRSAAR